MKRLWYKVRGQKLELDDIGGTRSSVYSVSILEFVYAAWSSCNLFKDSTVGWLLTLHDFITF